MSAAAASTVLPPFKELPVRKDGPRLNAWGLYGPHDELGRLNLITPETVRRGLGAARDGIVVNLNIPLDRQTSFFGTRGQLVHRIIPSGQFIDDEVSFNTQCGTQWDGFRHCGYNDWPKAGEYTYYNGMSGQEARSKGTRNGIQNFCNHPITSRAHLLDIPRYLAKHHLPPLVQMSGATPVTVEMLDGCAADEGVTFQPGDILVLNVGHLAAVLERDDVEEERRMGGFVGVEKSEDVARWHWDKGIAAVVSDSPAYEVHSDDPHAVSLHEIFLAGWGMPIGEFFDLRALTAECERLGRWTFLFASMPLCVTGGIASPPNAQAIL